MIIRIVCLLCVAVTTQVDVQLQLAAVTKASMRWRSTEMDRHVLGQFLPSNVLMAKCELQGAVARARAEVLQNTTTVLERMYLL